MILAEIEVLYLSGAREVEIRRQIMAKHGLSKTQYTYAYKQVMRSISESVRDTPIGSVVARSEVMLLKAHKMAIKAGDAKVAATIAARLVDIYVKTEAQRTSTDDGKDENGNVVFQVEW